VVAADRIDANVRFAQFLKLLGDEGEFGGRRGFAIEEIAALQKEVRALGNRKVNGLGECLAQTLAAFRELLHIHFAVIATEVVIGGAN
jgi:hypothetical protein